MSKDYAPKLRAAKAGRPKASLLTNGAEAKERLLKSARQLFQEKGYSGVVVRDVLQHAKLSAPTLYYHYTDKTRLYKAVVMNLLEEISEALKAAEEAPTFEDQLIALLKTFYRYRRTDIGAMLHEMTVHDEFSVEDLEAVGAIVNQGWRKTIERIVQVGIHYGEVRRGNVTFYTQAIIEIGFSFSRSSLGNWTGWNEERQVAEVAKLLLSGFGTQLNSNLI